MNNNFNDFLNMGGKSGKTGSGSSEGSCLDRAKACLYRAVDAIGEEEYEAAHSAAKEGLDILEPVCGEDGGTAEELLTLAELADNRYMALMGLNMTGDAELAVKSAFAYIGRATVELTDEEAEDKGTDSIQYRIMYQFAVICGDYGDISALSRDFDWTEELYGKMLATAKILVRTYGNDDAEELVERAETFLEDLKRWREKSGEDGETGSEEEDEEGFKFLEIVDSEDSGENPEEDPEEDDEEGSDSQQDDDEIEKDSETALECHDLAVKAGDQEEYEDMVNHCFKGLVYAKSVCAKRGGWLDYLLLAMLQSTACEGNMALERYEKAMKLGNEAYRTLKDNCAGDNLTDEELNMYLSLLCAACDFCGELSMHFKAFAKAREYFQEMERTAQQLVELEDEDDNRSILEFARELLKDLEEEEQKAEDGTDEPIELHDESTLNSFLSSREQIEGFREKVSGIEGRHNTEEKAGRSGQGFVSVGDVAEFMSSGPDVNAVLDYIDRLRFEAEANSQYETAYDMCSDMMEMLADFNSFSAADSYRIICAASAAVIFFMYKIGEIDEIKEIIDKVLTDYEDELDEDDPVLYDVLLARGTYCACVEELSSESFEYDMRAFEGYVRLLGENHRKTLTAMNCIALDYAALEQYQRAETMFKDCIERRKRVLGPDDITTINSECNYGNLFVSTGECEKAVPILEPLLKKAKSLYGTKNETVLRTAGVLLDAYIGLLNTQEAVKLWDEFRPFYVDFYGEDAESIWYYDEVMDSLPD